MPTPNNINNNRLLITAPYQLKVDGALLDIDPSFRTVLRTFAAFRDDELTNEIKLGLLIENIYIEPMEEYTQEAVDKAIWFIKGGKHDSEEQGKSKLPTVDFAQDAQYIYDAFLKKGIDLDVVSDIHWWTWRAHFGELPECFLTRLMYLRNKMRQPKGLDKDEKKECADIGWDIVNIKSNSGIDMMGNVDIWNI